jgi:hypothetical protein
MTSAFSRLRGTASGRIAPLTLAPVEGERVFWLGAEGDAELHRLSAGDGAEVSQTVDLTDVDMIGATLDTRGAATETFVEPVGFQPAADVLALWDQRYDFAARGITPPGSIDMRGLHQLVGAGEIEQAAETYSPLGYRGLCRQIPTGATGARLIGENTPRLWTGDLTFYTLDVWVDFDAASYASSTGVNPGLFMVWSPGVGGMRVRLEGVGGGLAWNPSVTHWNGAPSLTRAFPGFTLAPPNRGWTLLTFVFDSLLLGPESLRLYVDGIYQCDAAANMSVRPAAPSLGAQIYLASPELVGRLGAVRLTNSEHGPSDVLADFEACTQAPAEAASAWRIEVLIDGVTYCTRRITETESRRWTDYLAPVRTLSGEHLVAFRLTLEEVA